MSIRRNEMVQVGRYARQSAPPAFGDTIISVPHRASLTSLVVEEGDSLQTQIAPGRGLFKIRLADKQGRREAAGLLVQRRYAWRGYQVGATHGIHPNRITLSASNRRQGSSSTSCTARWSIGFAPSTAGYASSRSSRSRRASVRNRSWLRC